MVPLMDLGYLACTDQVRTAYIESRKLSDLVLVNREHPFQCPFNLRRFFRIKCIEYFLLSEVDVLVYDRLQFGDFLMHISSWH